MGITDKGGEYAVTGEYVADSQTAADREVRPSISLTIPWFTWRPARHSLPKPLSSNDEVEGVGEGGAVIAYRGAYISGFGARSLQRAPLTRGTYCAAPSRLQEQWRA
eukprot:6275733-Pyramimonas_sp.AAC.1